jgi:hypothetical protein
LVTSLSQTQVIAKAVAAMQGPRYVLGSGYVTKLESINCKLQADCGVQVVEVLERCWTGHRAEGAARLRGQAKAVRNFPHKEVQRRC